MSDSQTPKPVVNISIITPKAETAGEYFAMQLAQHQSLRGQVQGLIGGRFYRSVDDSSVVLVSVFETEADALRFREDPRLLAHMDRVRSFIEAASPGVYETAYEVGQV